MLDRSIVGLVLTRKWLQSQSRCVTDVSGSVVGVVRSRSLSCGHRQHTCGNYKAHQANSSQSNNRVTEAGEEAEQQLNDIR